MVPMAEAELYNCGEMWATASLAEGDSRGGGGIVGMSLTTTWESRTDGDNIDARTMVAMRPLVGGTVRKHIHVSAGVIYDVITYLHGWAVRINTLAHTHMHIV